MFLIYLTNSNIQLSLYTNRKCCLVQSCQIILKSITLLNTWWNICNFVKYILFRSALVLYWEINKMYFCIKLNILSYRNEFSNIFAHVMYLSFQNIRYSKFSIPFLRLLVINKAYAKLLFFSLPYTEAHKVSYWDHIPSVAR